VSAVLLNQVGAKVVWIYEGKWDATLTITVTGKYVTQKEGEKPAFSCAGGLGESVLEVGQKRYSIPIEPFPLSQAAEARLQTLGNLDKIIPDKNIPEVTLDRAAIIGNLVELIAKVWKKDELELLRTVLHDDDYYNRQGAATVLAKLGKPAIPILVDAVMHGKDSVATSACFGLGQMGEPGTEGLMEATKSDVVRVHWTVLKELVAIKSLKALPPLLNMLKEADEDDRAWAAYQLMEIKAAESVEALGAALRDESAKVREAAADALATIGKPAVGQMIAATTLPDPEVRMTAIRGLALAGDSSAVPTLIQLLKDESLEVRRAAIRALVKVGDKGAIEPLIEKLGDEDKDIITHAKMALFHMGSESVEALAAALKHKDLKVRLNAIEVLGLIGDARAVPALRELAATRPQEPDGAEAKRVLNMILRSLQKRT
jgi:HEAT repeat protein